HEARPELVRQRPDGRAVLGGEDDDVLARAGQGEQRLFVTRHRTISPAPVRRAAPRPCSSAPSASGSSGGKDANQRSSRASRLGTPRPRTVLASRTVGPPARRAPPASAASP